MNLNVLLFISLLLAILLILFLYSRLHRLQAQLSLIQQVLKDIKGGNLNRRALTKIQDETRQICLDINEIASNSQAQLIQQKQTQQGKTILISSHILSEISLLADDVGILDHGVLLEESSMKDLEKRNSKYILLEVSDIPKTLLILERKFQVQEYSVQDEHTVQIYDTSLNMGELNKALVLEGITLMNSGLYTQTLEDYFKNITGGEGIA